MHPISLHTLRRYEAGELDPAKRAEIETHAASCNECTALLSEMRAEKDALRVAAPFEALAARMEAGEKKRSPLALPAWLRWAWAPAAGLAGVAAVLLLAVPPAPQIQIKGSGTITVYGRAPGADKALPLMEGEKVGTGWGLRVEYSAGDSKFVTVVGVDADGKLYPYHEGFARPPKAFVSGSIVLDQDPRPERLYGIFSDAAIPRAQLLQAAKAAAAAGIEKAEELPGIGGNQTSWLLLKQ
jgi:hypothetical protein